MRLNAGFGYSPEAVIPRLKGLQKGEGIIYHTGFLSMDRRDDVRVAQIAIEATELSARGRIRLTQHRVRHGVYQYIATGT